MSTRSQGDLRELRLLVHVNGVFRRLCKLAFTKTDASIYLIPYAAGGRFYFGTNRMAEQQMRGTFNFKEQLESDAAQLPKLSIHQTGAVHAYVGQDRAGPLRIPPLGDWRGQHVATILADSFATLAPFEGLPKSEGRDQDLGF